MSKINTLEWVVTLWPLKNGGNGDEPWDGMGYFQTGSGNIQKLLVPTLAKDLSPDPSRSDESFFEVATAVRASLTMNPSPSRDARLAS